MKKCIMANSDDEIIIVNPKTEIGSIAITTDGERLKVSNADEKKPKEYCYINNVDEDTLLCLIMLNTFENHSSNLEMPEKIRRNFNEVFRYVYDKVNPRIEDESAEIKNCYIQSLVEYSK